MMMMCVYMCVCVYGAEDMQHSRLTLIRPDNTTHEANLVEEVLAEDDTSSYPNLIPAYHGMSASGNVTAEYVYVG